MTSRERVKRAVHFKGVDHIPHYLPDGGDNDILWLWPDFSLEEEPWKGLGSGLWEKKDIWGTLWRRFGTEGLGEAALLPLDSWEKFDSYSVGVYA